MRDRDAEAQVEPDDDRDDRLHRQREARAAAGLLVMTGVRAAYYVGLAAGACVDPDPPAMRMLVTVIATQDGQPVEDATRRLVAYGRPALVVLEAALHTADAPGRRRIVRAIERVGDPDAVPLLHHYAQYDEDPQVRARAAAAAATLAPSH